MFKVYLFISLLVFLISVYLWLTYNYIYGIASLGAGIILLSILIIFNTLKSKKAIKENPYFYEEVIFNYDFLDNDIVVNVKDQTITFKYSDIIELEIFKNYIMMVTYNNHNFIIDKSAFTRDEIMKIKEKMGKKDA